MEGSTPRTKICVLSQHPYPAHPTVYRGVEHLLGRGHSVTLICVAEANQPFRERHAAGTVYRLPVPHRRGGYLGYALEYAAFGLLALGLLTLLQLRHRFEIVQIDNLPDTLIFSALPAKWLGARLVLFMYELTPEIMASARRGDLTGRTPKLLLAIERLAVNRADHVITVSEVLRRRLARTGIAAERVSVVLNVRRPEEFAARPRQRAAGFTLVTHGTIVRRYGIHTVISALPHLRDAIPGLHLVVAGAGEARPDLEHLAERLGVADLIEWTGFLPWPALEASLRAADLGLVPIVGDIYGHLMLPNKLFDYVGCGVPVVASDLETLRAYFDDDCVAYAAPDDAAALAERVLALYHDPIARGRLASRASQRLNDLGWHTTDASYESALVGAPRPRSGADPQPAGVSA